MLWQLQRDESAWKKRERELRAFRATDGVCVWSHAGCALEGDLPSRLGKGMGGRGGWGWVKVQPGHSTGGLRAEPRAADI